MYLIFVNSFVIKVLPDLICLILGNPFLLMFYLTEFV